MRNIRLTSIPVLIITLVLVGASVAAMSSSSYSLKKSVLSGGGTAMGSANYQMTATLGQPSPIGICYSSNYINCPGFWSASRLEIKRMAMPWIQLLLFDVN